jgi:glutaredoxin
MEVKEMNKKFLGILISLITLITLPNVVMAASASVKETGLKDTINEEVSTFGSSSNFDEQVNSLKNADLSKYTESDDKVNVYIFRGSSCSHCLDAIVYFTSLIPEYGKYINIRTYETWSNKANANLMTSVGNVLGDSPSGVPYIVIGNKSFNGYTESMNEAIINQITSTYNSEDRYDVMNHLSDVSSATKAKNNTKAITVILVFLVIAVGGVFIYVISKSK